MCSFFLSVLAALDKRPMGNPGYLPLNSCCYPGMNCAFVDINGTVYASERTEHAPIGHIDKAPVDDKVVKDYVNKYYEISKKHCPACWAAKLCPKCFSRVKRGELNDKNFLEFCDRFRTSALKSLELFATIKEKDEKAFEGVQYVTADIARKRKEMEAQKDAADGGGAASAANAAG